MSNAAGGTDSMSLLMTNTPLKSLSVSNVAGPPGTYRKLLADALQQRPERAPEAEWGVAVFASNEAPYLVSCLKSLWAALGEWPSVDFTVLINGSRDGSESEAIRSFRELGLPGRVVVIPRGDKANAWNQYVYGLRPIARQHLFVDGYLSFPTEGLHAVRQVMEGVNPPLAVSGVPGGDTAGAVEFRRFLREHGGVGGGLHAIDDSFLARVTRRGIHLPLGLYRGDGLIGSFLCHDLDPLHTPWSTERIAVVDSAAWTGPRVSLGSPREARRHLQRLLRQARGRMENRAIRGIIYEHGYEGLPETALELLEWAWQQGPAGNEGSAARRILRQVAFRQQQRAGRKPVSADEVLANIAFGNKQEMTC